MELFPDRWKITDPDSLRICQITVCAECKKPFSISAGEQKYYKQHNLVPPRRCPTCRKLRKLERAGLSFGT